MGRRNPRVGLGRCCGKGRGRFTGTEEEGDDDAVAPIPAVAEDAVPVPRCGDDALFGCLLLRLDLPIVLISSRLGSLGGNFYGPDEWVDEDDLVVVHPTFPFKWEDREAV